MKQLLSHIKLVLKDPKKAMNGHFLATIFWIFIGIPVSILLRESVAYLVFLSVYAIIASHLAGFQGAAPSEKE